MTRKKSKRITVIIMGVLFTTLVLFPTGIAEGAQNTVQAIYKNLKIINNGQAATLTAQPVIINGSTYLPVRALGNLFSKNIDWNEARQEITITDKTNSEVESLKAQLAERDLQITLLQAQLDKNKVMDIDDLEDQLNDDYDDYEDIEWNFSLKGDEEDVTVRIDIDLDDFDDEWDDLSKSDIKDFLQDVCDDILEEFEDADISGVIRDSSAKKELVSFTVNSKGVVKVEESNDLDDLEDDLIDEFTKLGSIKKLDFELDGDEDDLTFTVSIDYDDYEDEWDDLDRDDIEVFMLEIKDFIIDELDLDYDDANIQGYIVDSSDSDKRMVKMSTSEKFSYYTPYN
ncbi:MAG: stalk domain-containing protein [Bacillota bacterium]|jgi:hypothetical protein